MSEVRTYLRPRPVKIPVDIRDEDRKLFAHQRWGPYRSVLDELVHEGLRTTDKTLFVHGMYLEWDETHGTRYSDFRRRARQFQMQYDEYIGVRHSNVSFSRRPQGDMAERLGVAGALTIASTILEVTEADFRKILPTSKYKTMDYSLELNALGPDYQLELEAKGTHDGKNTAGAIRDIREKKIATPQPRKTIRLGVVTDLASTAAHASKITLVDPPMDGDDNDLTYERLVNRLDFYLRRTRLLALHGRLAVALANRLYVLRRMRTDWRVLDGVELVGAEGERLPVERLPGIALDSGRWRRAVQVRPHPLERITESDPVLCFVHGMERRLLKALIVQHFSEILDMKFVPEWFEIQHRDFEGYLVVLPSGVVGGLAYVARRLLTRKEPERER